MFKSIVSAAVMASSLFAFGANVGSVSTKMGTLAADGSTYTATSLEYKASPSNSSAPYRTQIGWYAGIQLTWDTEAQNAKNTKASVSDSPASLNNTTEYTVYNNGDKTPTGCGMKNTTKTTGSIFNRKYWMDTTEWYIYVTPEFMYSLGDADYSATLTIGGNEYTIIVPQTIELFDGDGVKWYPAVGLLGDTVYGDAQFLADKISVENYETVTFLSDPDAAGVTFGDGFAASANDDGTWGVTMTHSHSWGVAVSADGAVLTATCGNAGCPFGGSTAVSLALSSGDKAYDGTAITASASFDEFFETIFPNVSTAITTTKSGETVETIKDVGEYTVTMTVTGLGIDQEHVLSRAVTISQVDISIAALSLTPATTTYNGAEQTVVPSVTVNNLTATFDVAEGSVTSATEIATYSVTVNGTGNFTGSATATWSIVNTTGSLKGVTPSVDGIGSIVNENTTNTLTIADSTALEYSEGAWFAGIALEWPVETKDYSGIGKYGYAHYITEESARVAAAEGTFTNELAHGSYQYNLISSPEFDYLSNTTWKVALTPASVEAALGEEKTVLEWTLRAGAIPSDTYEAGVAFADYAIALPLDEPIVFVLGEGKTYDLGSTVLTTTKIQLAAGASVTSEAAQTEGAIFTVETGYDIECTESDGVYTYTTKFTHVHDWSVSKAENGYELVATCANPECDINGGEVRMWLDVGVTEKTYDGNSVTRKAEFGEGFMTVYPDAAAVLTVNGVENGVINNAGEYDVKLTVTGVGEETYTLSRTVTISQVDISKAALVLTPATKTYNGAGQTVTPSVTVGGVTATLDNNGLEVVAGTCTATEIGTYPVTVNGIGNFTGTPASATWEIVNTTGEPVSVTESAAGSMTNEGNVFTLTDSSKLEYDAENKVWYAGITITWPMETHKSWGVVTDVDYVTEDMVKVTKEYGEVDNVTEDYTYLVVNTISYVKTTTWKVGITPAIVEAALGEEKTVLEWTMRAGAIPSDTYEAGVAFRDYTITIPLNEDLKLYDGDGKQVYPMTPGQTIIEEIKSDIAEAVSVEVAADASAKIDLLAEVAGEGNEQDVADWVDGMTAKSTPAEFFAELAQCDYVKASFELETDELITDVSAVEVAEFEATEGGFTLAVRIDGDDIEAARVKAARIIKVGTDLGSFGPLSAERIEISVEGEMTVEKDASAGHEFFKIVIDKDDEVD